MFVVPQRLRGLILAGLLCGVFLSLGASSGKTHEIALTSAVPRGWTNVTPILSPQPMAGAMMAYSSKAHRFVLFGGWDGVKGLSETWVYDPGNRTWTQLNPVVRPLGRGDEMFVYTERADAFVLFGGWHELANGTYVRLDDTWWFSLDNAKWTERYPAVSPSPRSDSEVAYDTLADAILLIGGFNGTAYLGDIWAYTPSNNTWSPRPAAVEPSRRADGRMVYVSDQDRFILFGGNDLSGPNGSNHHLEDTWRYAWSSNLWTPVLQSEGPGARDYPIFSFDPNLGLLFLAGGFGNTILSDLWAFDPTSDTWFNLTPARSPPPRFAAAGGFDPASGILVIFSGLTSSGLLGDTWQYSYGTSSEAPGPFSPILILGVGSLVVVGIAIVIVLRVFRKFQFHGPP